MVVRRTLPSIAAVLLIAGLLAAGVIAAPKQESGSSGKAGALSLMRDRPAELQPRIEDFQPQPARPLPRTRHSQPQSGRPAPPLEPIRDLAPETPPRPSRALGKPWAGRLQNGMQVPSSGVGFFTFDSALRRSPSRGWRRFGTDLNVTRTMRVLADFRAAHPDGPRLGIGDLSRTRGGPFGPEYGGLGHASHQNGQDIDLYYPRRDRKEVPPTRPSQVDRRLSQELVDRFVAAGAELVFVGPRVGLTGPRGVVQKLAKHDDHVHVRWPKR